VNEEDIKVAVSGLCLKSYLAVVKLNTICGQTRRLSGFTALENLQQDEIWILISSLALGKGHDLNFALSRSHCEFGRHHSVFTETG
jgi:hypothetical protein